ncbi:MAG: hypothetical protein IJ602_01840, partial [Paludibacteraceae bacterium]|nr:hypothetical protein [Paludibacteraceae bacterium]
ILNSQFSILLSRLVPFSFPLSEGRVGHSTQKRYKSTNIFLHMQDLIPFLSIFFHFVLFFPFCHLSFPMNYSFLMYFFALFRLSPPNSLPLPL